MMKNVIEGNFKEIDDDLFVTTDKERERTVMRLQHGNE